MWYLIFQQISLVLNTPSGPRLSTPIHFFENPLGNFRQSLRSSLTSPLFLPPLRQSLAPLFLPPLRPSIWRRLAPPAFPPSSPPLSFPCCCLNLLLVPPPQAWISNKHPSQTSLAPSVALYLCRARSAPSPASTSSPSSASPRAYLKVRSFALARTSAHPNCRLSTGSGDCGLQQLHACSFGARGEGKN
jgi:hypothetical protein